jgi:hypothetical protein
MMCPAKFVKEFHKFHVNLHKFHALFSMRLIQARLSQVLQKMDSTNAHGCAQNTENGFSFTFLGGRYHKDGDEFLNYIVWVTDDETWVSFMNAETKEQSKQWMHTRSPKKPKSLKKRLPETGQDRSADGGIHAIRDHNDIRSVS